MSCLSRLLGLICALLPGLLFLAFAVRFFQFWPELGFVTGLFYSLLSFITGATCLYLGVNILFGSDTPEESATPVNSAPEQPAVPVDPNPAPLRAAPLPVPVESSASGESTTVAPPLVLTKPDNDVEPPAAVDVPAKRIRDLASTRPGWQVTAPQLAQLTNLNMAVADATAREMVSRGEAQMQIGPNGETVYVFDLASSPD